MNIWNPWKIKTLFQVLEGKKTLHIKNLSHSKPCQPALTYKPL